MARDLKRRQPRRNLLNKVLIACEGKETEPNYFKAIRQDQRLQTVEIIILPHKRETDPQNIISQVIEARNKEIDDDRWIAGDIAWAVFDGDEHRNKSLEKWRKALELAKKEKIQLAITNPCFDFWYLLHFQDHFAQINSDRTLHLLRKHIHNYEKSLAVYNKYLKSRTESAINRGETIARKIQQNQLDEHDNPCCTGLVKLVQSLLKSK